MRAGHVAALLILAVATLAPARAGASVSSAQGTVFFPNPVQELGIQSLTDSRGADLPVFAPAYRRVTLTHLDGSGRLSGDYVRVKSTTGKPAAMVGASFPDWHRGTDQFDQVMGYYWVTTAQLYLQHLGFGARLPAVNERQVAVRISQFGNDNSFFRDDKTTITYGKGGVDDAEDAEVIVHEYGHSVQDSQVSGFGSSAEASAIGEGFSDYLAVAVTSWATGTPTLTDEACVADWDATSYTSTVPHCLRRLDGTKHYPADVTADPHATGEIWSRALWDIRTTLGDTEASKVIVDAQFGFAADTDFHAAAVATVAAAQRLYGSAAAAAVTSAFHARGIL